MPSNTEYACEVVRVTEVLPHPNADKLELVRFEMKDSGPTAYTVVDGKGQNRPGDLRVYCSVDSVVPVDGPFLFLAKAAGGRTRHRVRAARFRGVYSEGLLVLAPIRSRYGDEMSKDMGVTKYLNPAGIAAEDAASRNEAHRTAVRGLRARLYRNAWWKDSKLGGMFPEYSVVSLRKAPHYFTPGEAVEVTEKIHGANFRAGWVNGRFTFGTHRTVREGDHRPWHARLLRVKSPVSANAGWYKEPVFEAAAEPLREMMRVAPGLVFYGEVYGVTPNGRPIQDLTYGRTSPTLAFFAVYDSVKRAWLGVGEAADVISGVGLDGCPVLCQGEYREDVIRALAEGPSTIPGANHVREGVVVKSYDRPGIHGKWVGEDYRMRKE